MEMMYRRLLRSATLTAGAEADLSQALDLGSFRELHLVISVEGAGEGEDAKLVVRHAAVNDAEHYLDFETPAEVDLTTTGRAWFHTSAFTRWVCCFVSGTLTADATVTVDVVAKA